MVRTRFFYSTLANSECHDFKMGVMKMKRLVIVCTSFIFISLILTGISYANIDPASVMGMWLFNDKNDVGKDSSKNGNNGDVGGKPEWTDKGKFDGGLHFDATDDLIKVPMTIDYKEITVMVWVSEEGSPVRPRIVSNDHTDVSNKGFQLMYNTAGSGSWFDIGTGGTHVEAQFAYVAKVGEWYHYTGTYDGSKLKAYINGEMKVEMSASGAIADSGIDVHIGSSTYGFSDGLKGVLDEVAIFNKALNADDIAKIMSNGLEKSAGLIAVESKGKLASTWGGIKKQY